MNKRLVLSFLAACGVVVVIAVVQINRSDVVQKQTPVRAEGAAVSRPVVEIDPKALKAAEDMVGLFSQKDRLRNAFVGMGMSAAAPFMRENPGHEARVKIQKIAVDKLAEISSRYEKDALKDKASVYARLFTADEIGELKKFYESPVGRKLIEANGEITHKEAVFAQRTAVAHAKESRQAIVDELKKNGFVAPKEPETTKIVPENKKAR